MTDNRDLQQALQNLPVDAPEAIVDSLFVVPALLDALGFDLMERIPQYSTGNGTQQVDYALRHNTDSDNFTNTKTNPFLLIELKARTVNLSEGSPDYRKTLIQIKRYLLSPNCKSAQWGLITNLNHIQLFRKHGKVIYPATRCLEIKPDNINQLISDIRQKIENTDRALTVAIYNNKGGVGKTTTTVNLAAALTLKGKNVLVIDLDQNQRDLSNSLGLKSGNTTLYACLEDKKQTITGAIQPYTYTHSQSGKTFEFDTIPADVGISEEEFSEEKLRQTIKPHRLYQILATLKSKYDYILIDTPPNWKFHSVISVYAADAVLIPTKHNNIFSIKNAAIAIQNYIPLSR